VTEAERDRELQKLAALNAMFTSLGVPPPYSIEVADALDDDNLHQAVLASGKRLVYVQQALDEA
jgi:hypothetical protein